MRFYRTADTHLWADPEPEFRDDRLRLLVDEVLDEQQRHMVSRVFFGQATVAEAAREIEVPVERGTRLLNRGLEALREALQEEDEVGSVPAGDGPSPVLES